MMRQVAVVVSMVVACGLALASGQAGPPPRLPEFAAAGATAELAREAAFKKLLSPKAAEQDFDVMVAEPHHTGSPYELKLADYVAARFKEFGLEVSRREYQVLIPWPGERTIEVLSPDPVRLRVEEEVIPTDPSAAKPGILPAYNAYSPSGDVTGELVYVNYGVPADYEALAKLGVDVKGRIVLARYGGSWRGIKPKLAAEHGAVACLIYSDPKDDGYYQGDVYPDGPWRGWGMIQRGSVMDMPRYPGDPTTPDRPSKPGIERLPLEKVQTLSPVPVQPLSYRDGLELLKRLAGPVAPEPWRGALPVTYHVGPGPARIRVHLVMNYAQRPVVDVIGTLTGSVYPDEWVIIGGHRDAWVYGASDPISGQVSVLNIARAFGELARGGWKPRRSILFASWDGEEQGLLGSTEFVEDLSEDLRARAVVYLNRDAGAGRGWFNAGAVHSLEPFVREVARAVSDPEHPGQSLYDRWLEHARSQNASREGQPPIAAPPVGALGSGSDYTAFLDHLGIASIDMGISGDAGGTYHSIYDDAMWFRKFVDPEFAYSVAASEVAGIALLRFADADLLPFDYETYGRQIEEYVGEIEKQAKEPRRGSPGGAGTVDFAALRSAAESLSRAGAAVRSRGAALVAGNDARALDALNRALVQAERDLIEPSGLPDRPWFRHTIYAPGLYTGYGVKTIPGVREAVEAQNPARAAEQARLVVAALRRAQKRLEDVAR